MRPDLASCVSRVTSPEGDLKGEATIIQCGWTLVFDNQSGSDSRLQGRSHLQTWPRVEIVSINAGVYVPPLPDAAE